MMMQFQGNYYYAPMAPSMHMVIVGSGGVGGGDVGLERVARLAAGSAVVIFSLSSCCMCHAVKSLFSELGVSPMVHELDEDPCGREMERALARLLGGSSSGSGSLPVVFIGGKLIGAMDRVMASHINGTLKPLLKEAGALWL